MRCIVNSMCAYYQNALHACLLMYAGMYVCVCTYHCTYNLPQNDKQTCSDTQYSSILPYCLLFSINFLNSIIIIIIVFCLFPGGFGVRGIEGKVEAVRYARENKIPFLGICLGMQAAVIEYTRTFLNRPNANSVEFEKENVGEG